jgi:hypothetical protein
MNVGIGTVAAQFLSWEYLFRIFVIVSLQCRLEIGLDGPISPMGALIATKEKLGSSWS